MWLRVMRSGHGDLGLCAPWNIICSGRRPTTMEPNAPATQSRAVRSRVRLNVAISIDLFGDWWLLLIAVVLQLSEPLWRSG